MFRGNSPRPEHVSRVRRSEFEGWPMGLFFYVVLFIVACVYGWYARSGS